MTEAARLVDELTTLLYSPCLGTCITHGPDCRIVVCGACRRKADKPESVVHESDCPVYRLIRAEEANTAVIRANADEIADLEDKRDELEAKVNALTAQMESHDAQTARSAALEAENKALREERGELLRHQNTNECTRYGHRWRDSFGPAGALCKCGGMVFAVWAGEVRPSTEWERANPHDVRVIENQERSRRARDAEDEDALAAAAVAVGEGE
jgi:hypothetical protein